MRVALNIETHDPRLAFEIAGSGGILKTGTVVSVPGGVTLEYRGSLVRRAVGIAEVLQFIVDASVNVDLSLFAAWLFDKLKRRNVERVVIVRRVVTEITQQHIRQVLHEIIRSDE